MPGPSWREKLPEKRGGRGFPPPASRRGPWRSRVFTSVAWGLGRVTRYPETTAGPGPPATPGRREAMFQAGQDPEASSDTSTETRRGPARQTHEVRGQRAARPTQGGALRPEPTAARTSQGRGDGAEHRLHLLGEADRAGTRDGGRDAASAGTEGEKGKRKQPGRAARDQHPKAPSVPPLNSHFHRNVLVPS